MFLLEDGRGRRGYKGGKGYGKGWREGEREERSMHVVFGAVKMFKSRKCVEVCVTTKYRPQELHREYEMWATAN